MNSTQIIKSNIVSHPTATFSLTPRNLEEAMQYAKLIAESDFCPREHKGKPGNILICVQFGAELGLSPMQALQNISIINFRPVIWGDAMLGLVMAHPTFVNIHEELNNGLALCILERKGKEPVQRTFSIDDAKKANLWGKAGTWTTYPNRMLQMRARGFALRDLFPDVLKGLGMREEVEDYEIKPARRKINLRPQSPLPEVKQVQIIESEDKLDHLDLDADIKNIMDADSEEQLKAVYKNAYKYWRSKDDQEKMNRVFNAYEKRNGEINKSVSDFNQELIAAEEKDNASQ